MRRVDFWLLFSLSVFLGSGFLQTISGSSAEFCSITIDKDTISGKQILYNGRVWRNLYYKVQGDQFLYSKEFLTGSVTMNGKSFNNISLRYDICNDEIMIITDRGIVLQLNKEMVDIFSIDYEKQLHLFRRIEADSSNSLNGYVNVLYSGYTALYVKYKKEVTRISQGKMYDIFITLQQVYALKDGIIYPVNGKRSIINLLNDNKQQIRNYIKTNKIRVSKKIPESYVPVLKFYDSLRRQN
jgi:hypothetical protein